METNQYSLALSGSVLVLNRFYMAVHVVSVRRALVLLYRDLAEVIHIEDGHYLNYDFPTWTEISEYRLSDPETLPEDAESIRSVNFSLLVPRVVRLHFYEKVPKLTLRFNRRNLFARDSNTCQYCGKHFALSQLSFDHVIPKSRRGKTTWENVVCCCLKCNSKKGDSLPSEAGMKLIRKPIRPRQNPLLSVKLDNPKYQIWKAFLSGSGMTIDV